MRDQEPLTPDQSEQVMEYYMQASAGLYRCALAMLQDDSAAENAVQDTFETAMKRMDKMLSCGNPTGWLYKALRYKVMEMQRDIKDLSERCVPLDSVREPSSEMALPSELDLESSPELRLLSQFLVEGYKAAELAKMYGTTLEAMKMRIYRAKQRLREDPKMRDLYKSL